MSRLLALAVATFTVAIMGTAPPRAAAQDLQAQATELLSGTVPCVIIVDARGVPTQMSFAGVNDAAREQTRSAARDGRLACVVLAAQRDVACRAARVIVAADQPSCVAATTPVTASASATTSLVHIADLEIALAGGLQAPVLATAQAGGTGSSAALEETLQILGQIVVDRASQAAFAELQSRLRQLLHCSPSDTFTAEDHFDAETPNSQALFPNTCETLRTLRLQDVAAAPETLARALLEDASELVIRTLVRQLGTDDTAQDDTATDDTGTEHTAASVSVLATEVLVPLVRDIIVPALAGESHEISMATVRTIVATLVSQARAHIANPPMRRLATSVAAALECARPRPVASQPVECDIGAVVQRHLDPQDQPYRLSIVSIATHISSALESSRGNESEADARVDHLVDAIFDAACLLSLDFARAKSRV